MNCLLNIEIFDDITIIAKQTFEELWENKTTRNCHLIRDW
jgi:hypothetical protein